MQDWRSKLIGIGCDGANVNMGKNELKGKQRSMFLGFLHFGA